MLCLFCHNHLFEASDVPFFILVDFFDVMLIKVQLGVYLSIDQETLVLSKVIAEPMTSKWEKGKEIVYCCKSK